MTSENQSEFSVKWECYACDTSTSVTLRMQQEEDDECAHGGRGRVELALEVSDNDDDNGDDNHYGKNHASNDVNNKLRTS